MTLRRAGFGIRLLTGLADESTLVAVVGYRAWLRRFEHARAGLLDEIAASVWHADHAQRCRLSKLRSRVGRRLPISGDFSGTARDYQLTRTATEGAGQRLAEVLHSEARSRPRRVRALLADHRVCGALLRLSTSFHREALRRLAWPTSRHRAKDRAFYRRAYLYAQRLAVKNETTKTTGTRVEPGHAGISVGSTPESDVLVGHDVARRWEEQLAPVLDVAEYYGDLRQRAAEEFEQKFTSVVRRALIGPEAMLDPVELSGFHLSGTQCRSVSLDLLLERRAGHHDLLVLGPGLALPLVRFGNFAPRIMVGNVLVQRARWWFDRRDLELDGARDAEATFRAVQRLRVLHGLPRFCLAQPANERTPVSIDLDNPLAVDALVALVLAGPDARLSLAEMRPSPDALWLPTTSEFQLSMRRTVRCGRPTMSELRVRGFGVLTPTAYGPQLTVSVDRIELRRDRAGRVIGSRRLARDHLGEWFPVLLRDKPIHLLRHVHGVHGPPACVYTDSEVSTPALVLSNAGELEESGHAVVTVG